MSDNCKETCDKLIQTLEGNVKKYKSQLQTKDALIKELETNNKELTEEIERLNSRYSDVGFTKKLEKQAEYLSVKIELLTRCVWGSGYPECNPDIETLCQGCKNKALLEKDKNEN